MDTPIGWTDEIVKVEEALDGFLDFADDDIESLEFLPEWKEFVEAEVWNDLPASNTPDVAAKKKLQDLEELSLSPSDWCFEYLDEASTTKSNDTPSRSQPPTTPSHSPDDFSGLTPADIITDPSLVPVSPFDLLPGGVTKDEPEDLDLDIQIFLGLETSSSSPARRSISTDISSPPRRSPSTDVEGVHHHCPEKSCGQSFKRINALNRHISSIHKRTGVLCPFCPGTKKVFNRSDNFQRHVSTIHAKFTTDDRQMQACLKRLYQGTGRRTSWRK
ncbi:hypothetical protein FPQ18DRAFT_44319 [Pyronema domesticum]|nr:hypothetical protein FPQ18DRAFT_44319 [Pyronema domesticum]